MFSKCEFTECEKSQSCQRIEAHGTIIDFKFLCKRDNYYWYIPKEIKEEVTCQENMKELQSEEPNEA